jgi:hypothetical protein
MGTTMDATVVRSRVMTAAAMAAQALTDTEQPPDGRLRTLMAAHGRILAAWGPNNPLSFCDFRDLLTEDLASLLPDGVPPEEMQDVRLITEDGQFEEDLYDLQQEQRLVMRALAKATRGGRSVNGEHLDDEMDQERAYGSLKKGLNQTTYVDGRRALIETPAGPDHELRRLPISSSVADFYRPISHAATYDRWWFACPICHWPMKITIRAMRERRIGDVRCFHRPHAEMGAAYHFKVPDRGAAPVLMPAASAPPRPRGNASVLFVDACTGVPQPVLADGHKALTRGVWRWTTIPGRVEVDLYRALEARGLTPTLWPDLDAYDLHIEAGTGGRRNTFRIDLKDYTSGLLLAQKIQADGGDAGGAGWLVVPDYRASSVPLLTTICQEFDLRVATAGDMGSMICEQAGVAWA